MDLSSGKQLLRCNIERTIGSKISDDCFGAIERVMVPKTYERKT